MLGFPINTYAAETTTEVTTEATTEVAKPVKKKKVKKLVFADWKETDPQYTVRKGAKIKSIEFEGDGYTSSYDSKNRTITLTGKDPYIDSETVNTKTYSFL